MSLADDMEEIRLLLATYAINGDRLRLDALAETFAPDGVLESTTRTLAGRDAIREGLGGSRAQPSEPHAASRPPTFVRHNLTTSNLRPTGPDAGSGRTYFIVFSEIGPDHSGFYDDELVRVDGAWRFKRRRVRIDWVDARTVMPALLEGYRKRAGR